jgi:glycerol-3-phosphate dehydrogenase
MHLRMARRYACARTVSTGVEEHFEVVVIGAGVVGSGVSLELARRAVKVALLEAEPEPGLAASGTNSGIVHTGFDSTPGELETELILASARLRAEVTVALGIPMLRCGAVLRAGGAARDVIARARANGVAAHGLDGGNVEIPDESVTDPVAHTLALSAEAVRQGATLLTGHRAVAIFPRKGEFLVFDPPGGAPLERILLPVPTTRTRGVLVFPTIDGRVLAGPTAVDLENKHDWSVRPEARAEILPRAVSMYPPLEGAEPIAAYAGLRPAGRGINYLIGRSEARPWLVNVAAIRSTGLTASLGIAEHVAGIVASLGVKLSQRVGLIGGELPRAGEPWWRRTAEFRGAAV